jgi:pilus assembly protein CpaF
MIKLTITEKGGDTRALSFDKDEVSIGRVQGNDIVLPKGNISKRHTKLSMANGRIAVADLKSTNGTYVNGRRISEPMPVKSGDKVFVGDFLIVIDPGAAASETSGARRGPPPPPPPPRPGASAAALEAEGAAEAASALDASLDASSAGLVGLGGGRARAPAPPPPPPRRTIVTSALLGDSFDIGAEAPPSPGEVASDAAADVENDAEIQPEPGEDAERGAGRRHAGAENGAGHAGQEGAFAAAGFEPPVAADPGYGDQEPQPAGPEDEDAAARMFGSAPVPDEDAGQAAADAFEAPDAGSIEAARPTPGPDDAGMGADGLAGDAAAVSPPTLDSLLLDAAVTAIIISPSGAAQVERAGRWEEIATLGDGNTIAERVWQLANTAVPPPPSDNPVVDVRLADGTRVTALFPPITPLSVCAAIRKSTVPELSLSALCGNGEVEQILTVAVASRRNILVAGDRPAVTALAGAMASAIPPERQVVSIGAGARYRARWIELSPGGEPAALIRAAAAFRADHLLVADPGGGDLPDLLLAAARGQGGIIASVSARSATEALTRLRAFSVGIVGADAFAPLVDSTIDLVVFAATDGEGVVRLIEIVEPVAAGVELTPVFVARRTNLANPVAEATWEVPGLSSRLAEAIAATGDAVPAHLVRH